METILKQGCEKILLIFYGDKCAKIHLRDIARKTKLNENSASRFLKMLEKYKILHSKKDGNLKKYELLKNNVVYSIMGHFDVIKFDNLSAMRKNAVLYFLQKLKEQPIIAVLFGSTAKNIHTETSDIDLLLIVNKKIDTREAEYYVNAQTATKISPIQISLKELKEELKLKNDAVVQSAINTGYPVTNHIEFYRLMNNERI